MLKIRIIPSSAFLNISLLFIIKYIIYDFKFIIQIFKFKFKVKTDDGINVSCFFNMLESIIINIWYIAYFI